MTAAARSLATDIAFSMSIVLFARDANDAHRDIKAKTAGLQESHLPRAIGSSARRCFELAGPDCAGSLDFRFLEALQHWRHRFIRHAFGRQSLTDTRGPEAAAFR